MKNWVRKGTLHFLHYFYPILRIFRVFWQFFAKSPRGFLATGRGFSKKFFFDFGPYVLTYRMVMCMYVCMYVCPPLSVFLNFFKNCSTVFAQVRFFWTVFGCSIEWARCRFSQNSFKAQKLGLGLGSTAKTRFTGTFSRTAPTISLNFIYITAFELSYRMR